MALYARWWQLESWLRELVYVELRARHGRQWDDVVRAASGRQSQDATYAHMQGPDAPNPLAYLDYSQIVSLIDENWDAFDYALLTKTAWDGGQEELKRIRHRRGHMRRPHPDDLGRLEQTLRDLERGTFIALASYNDCETPHPDEHSDAVTRGWCKANTRMPGAPTGRCGCGGRQPCTSSDVGYKPRALRPRSTRSLADTRQFLDSRPIVYLD